MLSTLPARESNNPKNWKTIILIGLVILLSLALSGLSALYYTNILTANPDIIIINQTADNNSTNDTHLIKKVTNYTKKNNDNKNQSDKESSNDQKNEKEKENPNTRNYST